MPSLKHNKKRNTGLVYEFLLRRVAQQLLENDRDGYDRSVQILKKYYSDGQPLAAERELFEVIRSTRGVTESSARKILEEVKRHGKMLDLKKIEIKKSNLIKEVNYTFGQNFFTVHRVPDYRFYASVQLLIDSSRSSGLSESVDRIQIEESLVRFMMAPPTQPASATSEKVDSLVCALASKKFQERYGESLNRDQKVLLQKYMRSEMTGDKVPLLRYLQEEKVRIGNLLNSKRKTEADFSSDKIMSDRFDESLSRFSRLDVSKADENILEEMMLYHKLAEELESDV